MKNLRPIHLAAVVAVALLGAAAAGVVAHASASKVTTVKVTEREYHIALSPAKVSAGTVKFEIHNTGMLSHALSISGPGLKTTRTPLIKPGKTATLTVTLKSGTFSIWCPVTGHAALGMKTTLKAAGTSTSVGNDTTTPATTTTSSGGGGAAWP